MPEKQLVRAHVLEVRRSAAIRIEKTLYDSYVPTTVISEIMEKVREALSQDVFVFTPDVGHLPGIPFVRSKEKKQ